MCTTHTDYECEFKQSINSYSTVDIIIVYGIESERKKNVSKPIAMLGEKNET